MPIIVREIHTKDSLAAVNRIKSAVRKDGLGFSFDIPKEFLEKRNYMQSDEFIKDSHNAQMLNLGEKLGELREKIGINVRERNKTPYAKDEIVQGINGLSRIKKYLDINPKMNFSKTATFCNSDEIAYSILKDYKIGNLAKQAKKALGLR